MRVSQLIKEAESLPEEELTWLIARLMVVKMRDDEPEWINRQLAMEEVEAEG